MSIIIKHSDVAACPITSLSAQHYRETEQGIDCACGHPCEWFALCDHPATSFLTHPVLGAVPICDRCREKYEATR